MSIDGSSYGQEEEVPIDILVPLEGAVVQSTLDVYRTQLRAGSALEPIKVVAVQEGRWFLVVNGNHRALAAKLEGRREINALVTDSGSDRRRYEQEAEFALDRNRSGMRNMQPVANAEERAVFTQNEQRENERSLFWRELKKTESNSS